MCGKGEIFEADDEEIMKINKLLTDYGFSPISTNTMRLYIRPSYSEKSILHERIKG